MRLGITKWLLTRQIERIEEQYTSPPTVLGQLEARLWTLQNFFKRFHRDEEIRPLMRGNALAINQWNGNEWRSFWHVAMCAFATLLKRNDLTIWRRFFEFIIPFNRYKSNLAELEDGIRAFREMKKLIERYWGKKKNKVNRKSCLLFSF